MRLLVALNVDSWPDRIVRRAERELSVQVTQWGRWAPVTPDVTYIGDIWRESKLLLLTSIWFYSFALALSLQFRAFRTGLTQSISLKVIQILPASVAVPSLNTTLCLALTYLIRKYIK